jgi:hypothetical protein
LFFVFFLLLFLDLHIVPHIRLRKFFFDFSDVPQLSKPEETIPGIITTGKWGLRLYSSLFYPINMQNIFSSEKKKNLTCNPWLAERGYR